VYESVKESEWIFFVNRIKRFKSLGEFYTDKHHKLPMMESC